MSRTRSLSSSQRLRASLRAGEGYLQVADNRALVLVEEADDPDSLDRADIEAKLNDARESVEQSEEGSQERENTERNVRRWEAFLEIAGGS